MKLNKLTVQYKTLHVWSKSFCIYSENVYILLKDFCTNHLNHKVHNRKNHMAFYVKTYILCSYVVQKTNLNCFLGG